MRLRRPSASRHRYCIFSNIVRPGTSSTPPVITRPGSPQAWRATAEIRELSCIRHEMYPGSPRSASGPFDARPSGRIRSPRMQSGAARLAIDDTPLGPEHFDEPIFAHLRRDYVPIDVRLTVGE